jgi:hypothetical protein
MKKRGFAILVLAVVICVLLVAPVWAGSTAKFLKSDFLEPRNSVITGTMLVNNWKWYGIDVLPQLVILTAETSLGSPEHGGALVQANNFGCMRYSSTESKWSALSDGKVSVAGYDWFSFPTPTAGMMAWGRYLKVGQDGYYLDALGEQPYDWEAFARVYFGEDVGGFSEYVETLKGYEEKYRAQAAEHGFYW